MRSGNLSRHGAALDSNEQPASGSVRTRLRLAARWLAGATALAGFVVLNEAVYAFGLGFLFIPLVFLSGMLAIAWLPVPTAMLLFVGAAWLLNYTAFEALDLALTLLTLLPLPWVLRRAKGDDWSFLRRALLVVLGFWLWIDVANPLEHLTGTRYRALQDFELLQTVDIAENFAIFAFAFALLLVPTYWWWRLVRAQNAAGAELAGRERLARSLVRGLTFLVLASAAESLRAPWPLAILFGVWPLCLELRQRGSTPPMSAVDRVLVRCYDFCSGITDSRVVSRVQGASYAAGRLLLQTPVLLALTFAAIYGKPLLVTAGLMPPEIVEPVARPFPIIPASSQAEKCIRVTVSLAADHGLGERSDQRQKDDARKRLADGEISAEHYEFILRLQLVTADRFGGPGSEPPERRWSYEYTQHMAGIRCNAWFPR